MNIDDPESFARSCRTDLQAARALATIEAEISWGSRPQEWHHEADTAVASLLTRFPNARRRDAYLEPPTLSPQARAALTDDPPHRHRHPLRRRLLEAGAILAALALMVRWLRRRPRHTLAAGVVVVALAAGRPTLIGTTAAIAGMVYLARRRPGAIRPPRAPRWPTGMRAPAAPTFRRRR